jgi:serine/threonine protein kinase
VKLCDFGMCAEIDWSGALLRGCYGTAPYMSPEMAAHEGHSFSTDIWSYGATVYVLLYGDFPYMPSKPSSQAMKVAIICGAQQPRYDRSKLGLAPPSKSAELFARRLLERNPGSRCTAAGALSLPFLKATPKDALREAADEKSNFVKVIPMQAVQKFASESKKTDAGPQTESICDMGPVIMLAKQNRVKVVDKGIDPTVQRTLDELLRRLQEQGRGEAISRSFSEPRLCVDLEDLGEAAVVRRDSKCSTHTGVTNFASIVQLMTTAVPSAGYNSSSSSSCSDAGLAFGRGPSARI